MATSVDLSQGMLHALENPSQIREMIESNSVQHLKSMVNLLDSGAFNFLSTPSANSNRIITFLSTEAVVLDQMYALAEYTVTANGTGLTTGQIVRFTPNVILNLCNSILLNSNSFGYQMNSPTAYRSIPLYGNLIRVMEYGYDDMLLNSVAEDMSFLSGPTGFYDETNQQVYQVNPGKPIVSNGQASTSYKFYTKIPLSKLIPLTNSINLLSGSINLNISFTYQGDFVFNFPNNVTGFTLNRLMLHHDILKFNKPNPYLDVRSITSLAVKSYKASPQVEMQLGIGPSVSASVENTFITPQVGAQCFKMLICPRIESTSSAVYTYSQGGPTSNVKTGPIANSGMTQCLCLGEEFNITNVKVSVGGITLPSNIQPNYSGSYDADMYNYQYSIVQLKGLNTDGSSTTSCIPLPIYKKYYKVILVDLENLTANNLGNTQFDINYTITTANPLNVTSAGSVVFSCDVYQIYATEYTSF